MHHLKQLLIISQWKERERDGEGEKEVKVVNGRERKRERDLKTDNSFIPYDGSLK